MWLRRRRASVDGLRHGERVLAEADGPDGQVVATDWRLLWPDGSVGWHEIERASWNGDQERLLVEPVPTSGHVGSYRLPITRPGALIDVVRERVVGSVVISLRVSLQGRRGARITGRRKPEGALVWSVVLDPGVDPDEPATRALLDDAVASVRAEVE